MNALGAFHAAAAVSDPIVSFDKKFDEIDVKRPRLSVFRGAPDGRWHLDGRSITSAVAVGVAPVLVVLTALAVGTLIDLLGGPIHLGFLAFFLAGTFVLGQIVAFVGHGVGTLVASSA